ncbi:MAG TPA: hypothetical protein VE397_16205 [Stellaceae bacterium]|nr:hypothetical protein [Stellaceae bacterium]
MFDIIRGSRSAQGAGEARRREADPLARTIVMDLLITTAGFLLTVVAVVVAVQEMAVN